MMPRGKKTPMPPLRCWQKSTSISNKFVLTRIQQKPCFSMIMIGCPQVWRLRKQSQNWLGSVTTSILESWSSTSDFHLQYGPKVLGMIFFLKNQRNMRKTHTFFFLIQNKLYWHICRLLYSLTVSEKLPKNPLFGPPLIHQLWLLGSRQHPQSGVLLTSFSTWGTENSLAEIRLESSGVEKGL